MPMSKAERRNLIAKALEVVKKACGGGVRSGYANGGSTEPKALENLDDRMSDPMRLVSRQYAPRSEASFAGRLPGREDSLAPLQEHEALVFNPRLKDALQFSKAAGASALDPFGVPSAAVGLVSPEARDSWRAIQSEGGIVPQIAGSLAGGAGVASLATRGARGAWDAAGRMIVLGAGSDVLDEVAGKEGSISGKTAGKALLAGSLGTGLPRLPSAVGAGSGITMLSDGSANAAGLTPEQTKRQEQLRKKVARDNANRDEIKELKQLNNTEAAIAIQSGGSKAEMEKMRLEAELKERERLAAADTARFGKATESAEAAREAVLSRYRPLNETPFSETWLGSLPSSGLTAALGATTGLLLGGKSAAGAQTAAKSWRSALDKAEASATPSARFRAAEVADNIAAKAFPPTSTAGYLGQYVAPAAVGGIEGAGSSGFKTLWDRQLPDTNREKEGWQAYMDVLPEAHPDRARIDAILKKQMDYNPARKAAKDKTGADILTDMGMQAGIGAGTAVLGRTIGGIPSPSAGTIAGLTARTNAAKSAIGKDADETASRMISDRGADGRLQAFDRASAGEQRQLALTDQRERVSDALEQKALLQMLEGRAVDPGVASNIRDLRGMPGSLSTSPSSDVSRALEIAQKPRVSEIVRANQPLVASRTSNQSALPAPTAKSNLPEWAGEPPPGVTLKKGQYWHKDRAEVREAGRFAPIRYSAKLAVKGKQSKSGTKNDVPERNSGGSVMGSALSVARKYANGGHVHSGPIMGHDGGRADTKPISVPAGAYVLPGDFVSGIQGAGGNTLAGMKIIEQMFGVSEPSRADGGAVPIRISDGEYVLSPEQVARVGGGNVEAGHRALNEMVRKVRANHIKTLSSLPGPAQS